MGSKAHQKPGADEIIAESGLVAFCDILGYSSYLRSGDPVACLTLQKDALRVVDVARTTTAAALITRNTFATPQPRVDWSIAEITNINISDSSLFFMRDSPDPSLRLFWRKCFLAFMASFWEYMLAKGFPVRGGVVHGDFAYDTSQKHFAGKAIVEAHILEKSAGFSAIRIHPDIAKEMMDEPLNGCFDSMIEHLSTVFQYGCGDTLGYYLRTPLFFDPRSLDQPRRVADVRQYLIAQFSAHEKEIDARVLAKISETEDFIRFCRARGGETGVNQAE